MTSPTKSFFALASGAIIFAFAMLLISTKSHLGLNPTMSRAAEVKSAQSAMQQYRNYDIGLAFLYPKDWSLKTELSDEYYIITMQAPEDGGRTTIYVGGSYYALAGVEGETAAIAGVRGMNIQNQIYAVEKNGSFYTFEIEPNKNLEGDFRHLVESVEIF